MHRNITLSLNSIFRGQDLYYIHLGNSFICINTSHINNNQHFNFQMPEQPSYINSSGSSSNTYLAHKTSDY